MMKENIYALIMAGGSGTRFWPKSRNSFPKQFLDLTGEGSLIQLTAQRFTSWIGEDSIRVMVTEKHAPLVLKQLSYLKEDSLFLEPMGRNTAPCIGLAALKIHNDNPEGILIVVPSDHLIEKTELYQEKLSMAVQVARDTDALVTIGIQPDRAETGFGYIEKAKSETNGVYGVTRFVEKPDQKTAEKYFESGNFLWNAGMFIFKASTMISEFEKHSPDILENLKRMIDDPENASKIYSEIESVSIDYAIMEKADSVKVIPADVGWNDLGAWTALEDVCEKMDSNVVLAAESEIIDSTGNIVDVGEKLVALVGVDDLIVVSTDDIVMVCRKSRAQDVKKIVESLNKKNSPHA